MDQSAKRWPMSAGGAADERESRSWDECGNNVPLEFAMIEMWTKDGGKRSQKKDKRKRKRKRKRETRTRFTVWDHDKVTECPINALMSLCASMFDCGEPGSRRLLTHIANKTLIDVDGVTLPFRAAHFIRFAGAIRWPRHSTFDIRLPAAGTGHWTLDT